MNEQISIHVRYIILTFKLNKRRQDEKRTLNAYRLPAVLGPGVYSSSNRNEYQKQKNNVSGEKTAAGA
jgi:hypothetical protein